MQQGNISPAQWYRDTRESLPVQWILGGLRPGQSTLYDFQRRFDPIIDQLNTSVLKHHPSCEPRRATIDGTYVAANTTRHKLLNKSRLTERLLLLEHPPEQDGVTANVPRWLAPTERGKARQRNTYRHALNRIERLLEKNAKLPAWRRKPENKVLISPTDSEAPLGRDKQKTYRPLDNVQLVRDLDTDWITAYETLATNTDIGTLEGTLDRCQKLSASIPSQILTDASYATERDMMVCEQKGVTLYAPYRENTLSPSGKKKANKRYFKKEEFQWNGERQEYRCPGGEVLVRKSREYRMLTDGDRPRIYRYRCSPELCLACERSSLCTPSPQKGRSLRRSEREDLVESLRARMEKPESQELYRRRSASIERCFGEMQGFGEMRAHHGLSRFSRRGLQGAKTTVGLWVLLHNGLLWLKEITKTENTQKNNHPPPDF